VAIKKKKRKKKKKKIYIHGDIERRLTGALSSAWLEGAWFDSRRP
jgi:hypothetical protein